MEHIENTGLRIRDLLKKKNITTKDAAEKLGITPNAMGKILQKPDVSTRILKDLSKNYSIPMFDFFLNSPINITGHNNANRNSHITSYISREPVAEHSNESKVLQTENEALKRENALLREMVELLKKR